MRAVPSAKGAFYSGVPQGGVPYFGSSPVVLGTPTVGSPVSYTAGTVTGSPTPTRTQQWLLDGQPISGATAPTYTPIAGDAGHLLSVRQTETNTYGVATVNAADSAVNS